MFRVDDIIGEPIEKAGSHIVSAEFVPLCSMSEQDWENLGWHEIRSVAKNRIAQLLRSGILRGFIPVVYDKMPLIQDTGSGGDDGGVGRPRRPRSGRKRKPAYYYGRGGRVSKAAATSEDVSEADIEQINQWASEPEEEPSRDTDIIDEYVEELQLEFLYDKIAILRLISALRMADACSGLMNVIENGINERGPVWAFVLIVALITYFGFDRAFEMIEEVI